MEVGEDGVPARKLAVEGRKKEQERAIRNLVNSTAKGQIQKRDRAINKTVLYTVTGRHGNKEDAAKHVVKEQEHSLVPVQTPPPSMVVEVARVVGRKLKAVN